MKRGGMYMPIKIAAEIFYSAEEVAAELQLKLPTIRGFIRKGKLKAKKVGRKNYISEHEFLMLMNDSSGNILETLDLLREESLSFIAELIKFSEVQKIIKNNESLYKIYNQCKSLKNKVDYYLELDDKFHEFTKNLTDKEKEEFYAAKNKRNFPVLI